MKVKNKEKKVLYCPHCNEEMEDWVKEGELARCGRKCKELKDLMTA